MSIIASIMGALGGASGAVGSAVGSAVSGGTELLAAGKSALQSTVAPIPSNAPNKKLTPEEQMKLAEADKYKAMQEQEQMKLANAGRSGGQAADPGARISNAPAFSISAGNHQGASEYLGGLSGTLSSVVPSQAKLIQAQKQGFGGFKI